MWIDFLYARLQLVSSASHLVLLHVSSKTVFVLLTICRMNVVNVSSLPLISAYALKTHSTHCIECEHEFIGSVSYDSLNIFAFLLPNVLISMR